MTRLRSLIKEVLSTPPKKKDCNCGCGGCGKKAPALTESKTKTTISEGLQYHIDKKVPLHESVYRIGSEKHFALINEARALWVRELINVSEDDQAILETHLGNFGLYEGEEVPLDLPMVSEEEGVPHYTKDGKEWKGKVHKMPNGKLMTQNPHNEDSEELFHKEDLNEDIYDKFLDDPQNPKGRAKAIISKFIKQYGKDASGMAVDRFAKQNNLKPEEKYILQYITKNDISISSKPGGPDFSALSEATSKYPDFDLDKNIKYQDTSISSGMWRYTGKEQGGKGVYRNLMNDQFLGFSSDDFYFFKKHLGSHFDISESLDESVVNEEFPGKGEIVKAKDLNYDMLDYFNRMNIKLLINTKSKKNIKGSVGTMFNDLVFNGDDIDKKDIVSVEILESVVTEAKKKSKKKDPPLNKPKRGGSKAYYVYVRDPKTKKIKKVSFGSGGLRAKIKNKQARNAFAARHNCKNKKDRTKAGYWSCNLPRYAEQLGLGSNMNTFW